MHAAGEGRVCAVTGLYLVPPPSLPVHRIAQVLYGGLTPPVRDDAPDRQGWGRWDTAGGRTIYAAASAMGAFAELLAYLTPGLPTTPASAVFDDLTDDEGDMSIADLIRKSMPEPDIQRVITRDWRSRRRHYLLQFPADGWFVDIVHAESVAAINREFTSPAERDLTTTDLTGDHRSLTTDIASWARNLTLDDGSRALGVTYLSKHGHNLPTYALWLRAVDDGHPIDSEPTRIVDVTEISGTDVDLVTAAGWNRLRIL